VSIALAAMSDDSSAANAAHIPLEVLHRVARWQAEAWILPHNGAVITLLAVTGLTHKTS
jgi:H+/gluconate symporter-like permease